MPHFVSQAPECMTLPSNLSRPGVAGHAGSLSSPRAVTRTLAISSNVSPVKRFCTLIFLNHPQLAALRRCGMQNLPFILCIIPLAVLDLMRCLDEPRCSEPLGHVLKVLQNLTPRGIEIAPVGIWSERVLVRMCYSPLIGFTPQPLRNLLALTWNIAGHTLNFSVSSPSCSNHGSQSYQDTCLTT